MSFSRIGAVVLRQLYLVRGSAARLLPHFLWGAIEIVLWGFLTRYLDTVASSGLDFVATLLGAVLLWNFFTRITQGVTTAFLEDIWSRNFVNLFASPISIREYVSGLVATAIVTGAVGIVSMFALAFVAFGLTLGVYGAALLPFLLVLFLFGIAIGIAATAVMLRFGPASEWFIWPIPALIAPLAGVFYPVSTLPAWMQPLARALPPSYVFEGMRTIVNGGALSGNHLLIGTVLAIVWLAVASWLFARVYRLAVRTGLLARYSAESAA